MVDFPGPPLLLATVKTGIPSDFHHYGFTQRRIDIVTSCET